MDRFRIDTSGVLLSPRTDAEIDPFPGVSGTIDENPLYAIDPDAPAIAEPDPKITDLLKEIRDNTKKPFGHSLYWTEVVQLPNTTDGEISVYAPESFRNLYVARAPRPLNVYAGVGKTLFLASIPIGKSLRSELPFIIDGITLEWVAATPAIGYVTVVFSSEPFKVEII
jgi:hypothetical protein